MVVEMGSDQNILDCPLSNYLVLKTQVSGMYWIGK